MKITLHLEQHGDLKESRRTFDRVEDAIAYLQAARDANVKFNLRWWNPALKQGERLHDRNR